VSRGMGLLGVGFAQRQESEAQLATRADAPASPSDQAHPGEDVVVALDSLRDFAGVGAGEARGVNSAMAAT
jgi:hypothetical protein